jgi:hypothetical protein
LFLFALSPGWKGKTDGGEVGGGVSGGLKNGDLFSFHSIGEWLGCSFSREGSDHCDLLEVAPIAIFCSAPFGEIERVCFCSKNLEI